jgi:hypothetical protein
MLEPAADAWRYIFSSRFRAAKHEQWRHEHFAYIAFDVFWALVTLAVSIGVLIIAGFVVWQYIK